MLWLVGGDYRNGKTTYITLVSFSEEYQGREVWGNYNLIHPRYRKIEVPDLMEIVDGKQENVLVILDEFQNWFNSHESFSITNEFLTDFIHMCDKTGVDVYGTTHRFDSIDIDFRWGCHRIVICERRGKQPRNRLNDKRDFIFTTFSTYSGNIVEKKYLRYETAIPYFEVFNTKERIVRHRQPERDLRLLMAHNSTKGIELLEEIARKIIGRLKGKEITHARLRKELGKMGYGKAYEEEIYVIIKDNDY